MIESLHVSNYVLIDNLDLNFTSGLNAITGETGSGKSILLGALSLLLGARGDREDIRKGKDRAEVSGVFYTSSHLVREWCENHDIPIEDNTLIIRRILKAEGRSLYTVNGCPVTMKDGEELGELLVDFSSQHAHHSLMKKEVLRTLVDDYSKTGELLSSYRDSYREMTQAKKNLEETKRIIESGREEADYMSYCADEIAKAALVPGEEEELRDKLKKESNSAFLVETVSSSVGDLRSASGLLGESSSLLYKALKKDESLSELQSRLESSIIEIDDICSTLRDYTSSLTFSDGEIEEMNARLSVIQRIRRRYGGSVESALETLADYRNKLSLISDSSDKLAKLEKEVRLYTEQAEAKAEELSRMRKKGAIGFSKEIEATLHKLGMENAVFTIEVEKGELTPFGRDKIEFLIQANKGEKISPIQNAASGGELSRIMLAIKASGNTDGGIETLLFDEIDSGLGGVVASFVGQELKELSKKSQVITITHLSQIAGKSDSHFLVEKADTGERTVSTIRNIEGEERVREIARLLSGDTSAISLEHARSLLSESNS